jgi:Na+/H+-dicarboxylate symporter
MNDMKRVGRVALRALGYFLAITLVALVIARRWGRSARSPSRSASSVRAR